MSKKSPPPPARVSPALPAPIAGEIGEALRISPAIVQQVHGIYNELISEEAARLEFDTRLRPFSQPVEDVLCCTQEEYGVLVQLFRIMMAKTDVITSPSTMLWIGYLLFLSAVKFEATGVSLEFRPVWQRFSAWSCERADGFEFRDCCCKEDIVPTSDCPPGCGRYPMDLGRFRSLYMRYVLDPQIGHLLVTGKTEA